MRRPARACLHLLKPRVIEGHRFDIAAVDAFDAMTCERPYRAAKSREEALDELRREAGAQFDPSVVDLLCSLAESGALEAVGAAGSLGSIDVAEQDLFDSNKRGAA